ncbi:MAG: photosystem II cytochrome PsbV2 [Coleofasciculus sp. G3-WIS-01]|uniref:photosystem II cytochrome PsbV2 n=1 Tax=Coleofasciculus sp. G3-WIS-01 TaxID=3069528 RepID=UPI0032FD4101
MLNNRIKSFHFSHSFRYKFFSVRSLFAMLMALCVVFMVSSPAYAIDDYVKRFLKVTEPIALDVNEQGQTKEFTPDDLAEGKELFKAHCINCHVGGTTLQDPRVSLGLETLAGATPPRDNVDGIISFLREPMTYDGSDPSFWCRQVPDTWMPQEQIEKLAAFVLRAAQKAPGWGEKASS